MEKRIYSPENIDKHVQKDPTGLPKLAKRTLFAENITKGYGGSSIQIFLEIQTAPKNIHIQKQKMFSSGAGLELAYFCFPVPITRQKNPR